MSLTPASPFLKSVLSTGPSSDSQDVRLIVRSLEKLTLGTGTLTQTFASVASDEYRPLIDITIAVTGGQFLSDATLNLDSLNHRVGDLITIDYTSSDIPAGRSIFIKDLKNATTLATLTANSSGILTLSLDSTNTWVVDDTLDTGTFAIKAPDGTVSAPSLSFASDTNTGLYRPGGDQLAFAIGGIQGGIWTTSGLQINNPANGTGGVLITGGTSGGATLAAQGTNQNITLTPSGTGVINVLGSAKLLIGASGSGPTLFGFAGGNLQILGSDGTSTGLFLHADTTHLLLGGLTVDGIGVLQFPAATTSAGGITMGTDVHLYRSAAAELTTDTLFRSTNNSGFDHNAASGNLLLSQNTPIISRSGTTITFLGNAAWTSFVVQTAGSNALTLDSSQNATFAKLITSYNGIATPGNGVVTIQGAGSSVAQTAAVASIATYTVGASDADFIVSGNVLVTTATAHSFSLQCTYTDESNVARTVTFNVQQIAGTLVTAITNVTGAGPYEGVPLHIRAKAGTAITILTSGTFTTVTYNARAVIRKLQ